MRKYEVLTTNNNCTWEDVYNPIESLLSDAFAAWTDKEAFFETEADDFLLEFVMDYWDGDENLGQHIQTGNCVFPYTDENWNSFKGYFNAAMDDIRKEYEAEQQ